MANKKGSRQLTWTDRISIEALKKAGHSVIESKRPIRGCIEISGCCM